MIWHIIVNEHIKLTLFSAFKIAPPFVAQSLPAGPASCRDYACGLCWPNVFFVRRLLWAFRIRAGMDRVAIQCAWTHWHNATAPVRCPTLPNGPWFAAGVSAMCRYAAASVGQHSLLPDRLRPDHRAGPLPLRQSGRRLAPYPSMI